jgi:hypothetical protein
MIKDFLADTDAFDMPIVREAARPVERVREAGGISVRQWVLGFAGLAALMRVAYLLIGTSDSRFVAWYIDSFHHWQISYLSKEIGLAQGRLWDLGGMEYFWGAIPALLGALAMAVTFSSDLWPMQLMNIVAGSASVGVLYLVGRRYWGHWAGIALALFFAVSPVSVLTDASVMQEPVAFLFLVLALYFFVERPLLAGVLLGLAASSRPDYWLYSGAILATGLVALRARGSLTAGYRTALPYVLGYAIGIGPYVLHLWLLTGNPVYSLYWNFLGNVRGEWMPEVEPTVRQLQAQAAARVLFGIGIVGLAITAWRRPTGWPVIAAGLWGLFLIGYVLGISKYILGYLDRFWFDRIMLLPYLAVAVLIAVGVARLARVPRVGRPIAGLALAAAVIGLSAMWVPIGRYQTDAGGFQRDLDFADRAAAVATTGRILVPGDAVVATYGLVHEGVGAQRLLSQLYHPEEPAALAAWLREMDVRWIFLKAGDGFWSDLVRSDPERFPLRLSWVYDLYEVRP